MIAGVKKFFSTYHRPLFYSAWLLLHLIQSSTTELFDDEAYYWVYSRFPAWGYFDHPPVIAILIKAGYAIFENEFGVRVFTVLLTTASLYLIECLTSRKDPLLFYAICASLAIAQIGGIMAVPDTPMMFFVAFFFLLYRRFITNTSVPNALLLGICMAMMLYTKYHAILIILFTLASNPSLLRTSRAYLAVFTSVLLFVPHLYWQHVNNFPSLQFHLFERNSSHYEVKHTLEFIAGQLLLAGPLVGWLLLPAAQLFKSSNLTEKALKYSFTGIYLFFLVSTLKGKAEANWTIPAFVGLIVLSHQFLITHEKWKRILYKTVPVTLLLVLMARVVMMVDLPPAWWILKDEFHGNKTWVQSIRTTAGSKPVVFLDTYQKASKYWFYSGDTALALNTPTYRRNNFNYWKIEDVFIGREAYVVGLYHPKHFPDKFNALRIEKNGGTTIDNYYSFSRVFFDGVTVEQSDSATFSIHGKITTPPNYLLLFRQQPYDTSQVYLAIYKNKKLTRYQPVNMLIKDIVTTNQQHISSFNLPLKKGKYTARIAVSSCVRGHPSLNSSEFEFKIE